MFRFNSNPILALIVILGFLSCERDRFLDLGVSDAIELNENCESSNFYWPVSTADIELCTSGRIGDLEFRLCDGEDDFEMSRWFSTYFTTSSNSTGDNINDVRRALSIKFVRRFVDFYEFHLLVPYEEDVHTGLRAYFLDTEYVDLSTNEQYGSPEMRIDMTCENRGIEHSTLYSTRENQQIQIHEFKYKEIGDSVKYNLRFSAADLEIVSRQFNDSDPENVKDMRGDFNPVYPVVIDDFVAEFTIVK